MDEGDREKSQIMLSPQTMEIENEEERELNYKGIEKLKIEELEGGVQIGFEKCGIGVKTLNENRWATSKGEKGHRQNNNMREIGEIAQPTSSTRSSSSIPVRRYKARVVHPDNEEATNEHERTGRLTKDAE